jgi:sugar phosphate isomerase/epimerase
MRDLSADTSLLSINSWTVKQWPLDRLIDACARRGIRAIAPWHEQVNALGLSSVRQRLDDAGMVLSGYCRAGMFPVSNYSERGSVADRNKQIVDEARELNAPCVVVVVGGLPGAIDGNPAHKNITAAREDVRDGLGELLEYAREVNMPLAIEPLHPMYAADRACVNTLEQALDLCDELDPGASGALGVAVDVYHTWWDPKIKAQIQRAGAARLLGFHVCDWLAPTRDLLTDRGMMGDGVIDIRGMRSSVEAAGFTGFVEVEIFSAQNWWKRDGEEVLDTCIERYRSVV